MPSEFLKSDNDPTRIRPSQNRRRLGVGSTLINGTYIVEEFLARGGMGEVYRARHVDHDTQHAIKVILPELANDETILQLFIREARELGRINSDAIVRYQGFLRDETESRCLIMEFVDGESLKSILQDRALKAPEVLLLLERIGRGLAVAHDLGIVHRDISPENIIIPGGDIAQAKLIDFGIAKSADRTDPTLIGSDFAGKFSFVSPEQVGLFGGTVDVRSDIYSLGLVLAAAALGFGKKLDMGGSPASVIQARQVVPDLTTLPTSLRPLLGHMLQAEPGHRPASIRALLQEVRGHTAPSEWMKSPEPAGAVHRPEEPIPNSPPMVATRNRIGFSLRKARMLTIAAGGVVIVAGSVFTFSTVGPRLMVPSIEQMRSDLADASSGHQCADLTYSVAADRTVKISGYVSGDQDLRRLRQAVTDIPGIKKLDFDVQLRIWPYCEALSLLKPHFIEGSTAPNTKLLTPANKRYADQKLILGVRAPNFDGYVYVDYYTPAGKVVHLFPNDYNPIALRPLLNNFVLGRPPMQGCWTLPDDAGEQMITVIASKHRLFDKRPPSTEMAKEYLERLSDKLAADPAQMSAAVSFFKLNGDRPPGLAADRCARR